MRHHHHHHSHDTHFFGAPRRGFGRGRFGGWFADGGELGGRGFGMGRKLASADLQLLILELLAEKPRHGYEIIKALEERSKGFYVPSPGMVYPALTYLEEIGHATVETEGPRKLYHLTDLGRPTSRSIARRPMPCLRSSDASGSVWNICAVSCAERKGPKRSRARRAGPKR